MPLTVGMPPSTAPPPAFDARAVVDAEPALAARRAEFFQVHREAAAAGAAVAAAVAARPRAAGAGVGAGGQPAPGKP
jgi:hypothetical protein